MKDKNKTITQLLLRLQGMDVSKYDDVFLYKILQQRIAETLCETEATYYALLEQHTEEVKLFGEALQINYSEFFRNSLTFAVLEHIIFPSLMIKKKTHKNKEIRIWSAACASGQEAYSLAILLEELKLRHSEKFNYRIFATDQSEIHLKHARSGNYEKSALNMLSVKRINQCFVKHGDTYSIKAELKEKIDFSVFDLLNEQLASPSVSIYGDFDLVVAANLLFYYKPEYRKKILNKICNALNDEGFLICGETEREIYLNNNLMEVFPHSAIFRKGNYDLGKNRSLITVH